MGTRQEGRQSRSNADPHMPSRSSMSIDALLRSDSTETQVQKFGELGRTYYRHGQHVYMFPADDVRKHHIKDQKRERANVIGIERARTIGHCAPAHIHCRLEQAAAHCVVHDSTKTNFRHRLWRWLLDARDERSISVYRNHWS